jgi:hypothetical protein
MQKLNIQDLFRSQAGSLGEPISVVAFGNPAAEEFCSVFATAYNEDTNMTRIYCCRPLPEQDENIFEK